MAAGLLIGIGTGLASALLFYSAGHGSPLLSTLLFLLTPLPSLLAGLGWGWLAALAGALAGALAMGLVASTTFAVGYFLALGLPVAIIAYITHLSRPARDRQGHVEWFPAGRLLAALALYGGALPVLLLPLIGGSYEGLREPLRAAFESFAAVATGDLGVPALSQEQIAHSADLALAALPAVFAAYWVAIFALNLYLAGRIARASGRLRRDWPDLPATALPRSFPFLLAAALLACLASGAAGVLATSFTGGLMFAHLLGGLALVHLIARQRAPWLLWLVYAALVAFGPYTALVLTLAGFLDPIFAFKRRLAAHPPLGAGKA
jgi:hypothetical protein